MNRSACRWAGRVLVVNGHGGNLDALRSAVPLLRAEGRDVAWFPCGVPRGDAHAGRTETSLMLHVEPEGVLGERAVAGETTPIGELLPRGFERLHGKRVFDLRPPGLPHKGDAVLRLGSILRPRGASFVGDDATDETVFRLRRGWGALLTVVVGARAPTAARHRLPRQAQVDDLLRALLCALGG